MANNFSIVVLSYNLPDLTERCLASIQKKASGVAVVVVHNGSSKKNFARLKKSFPHFQHLFLSENKHFSGGANHGIAQAFKNSEWLLFITNDCQLLELGQPPAQIGLAGPLIFARNIEKIDSIGGYLDFSTCRLSHCKSESEFKMQKNSYIPGTAFWIHRKVFVTVGGFDEGLETYWEDVDLSFRARQEQFPLMSATDTHIIHSIGKTCHKDVHYTTYLFQRNRWTICLKYGSNKLAIRLALGKDALRYCSRFIFKKEFYKVKLLWQALTFARP